LGIGFTGPGLWISPLSPAEETWAFALTLEAPKRRKMGLHLKRGDRFIL
jgi:hypothetical protein